MLTEGWDDSLAWMPLEVAAFVSGRVMGTAEIATTASQTREDRWAGNTRHCNHRKDFIMMTSSIYRNFLFGLALNLSYFSVIYITKIPKKNITNKTTRSTTKCPSRQEA
jgi:hypothetical protein